MKACEDASVESGHGEIVLCCSKTKLYSEVMARSEGLSLLHLSDGQSNQAVWQRKCKDHEHGEPTLRSPLGKLFNFSELQFPDVGDNNVKWS